MTWLGPSIIFLGTPFVFGYAVNAVRSAPDKGFSYAAVIVTGIELGFLVFLLTVSAIAAMMTGY